MPRRTIENFQSLNIPLYEQVRWKIQLLLTDNNWDKDTPIPTELELADQYDVSIGTVRKAVEKLVEDGVLFKKQGRGTFLKQPSFEASLSRFFKFRDKDMGHIEPTGLVKKIVHMPAIEKVNKNLNLKNDESLVYIERVRMFDNVVILSEKIWLPHTLFKELMGVLPKDYESLLYPFYYKKCGQFVSSAVEKLSFITDYTDNYLNNNKKDSLVKVCRIAKNLKGQAIEYRESYGLAENFSYEVHIN